jgi:Fe-Mn family superoxide dismutase
MINLMKLPFDFDSLEPEMDAKTVEVHYSKHHQAYVDKLNSVIGDSDLKDKDVEWILSNLDSVPSEIRQKVINFAGGVYNHNFFWSILGKGKSPNGTVLENIEKKFGSYEKFVEEFTTKSMAVFGSGWLWLVLKDGEVSLISTPNQDSVLEKGMTPLLVIDLWEHAYYLKYQSARADYVKNFFKILDWDTVNGLYASTKS